jgi:hypothetical protein
MHDDLAARLFGVGEPDLDFAALIERVRRTAGSREA